MLTDRKLEQYIVSHSEEEDEVLEELDRETNLHVLNPRMLSGHLQGKILEIFSRMIGPEQILEIGTYTGYSAICLARGLKEGGQLHTVEIDDELESIALKYFIKAGRTTGSSSISARRLRSFLLFTRSLILFFWMRTKRSTAPISISFLKSFARVELSWLTMFCGAARFWVILPAKTARPKGLSNSTKRSEMTPV